MATKPNNHHGQGAIVVMDMNQREYQTVILAGFLHDIGKILMRGDFGAGLNIKGSHPEVSARFVSVFKDVFSQVADTELLQLLTQRHHEDPRLPPQTLVQGIEDRHQRTLATLISEADNFSSSERGERSEQWQDYKATPMMSILERVNQPSDEYLKLHFRPRPLSSVKDLDIIFPEQFQEYAPGELNKHLKSFGQDFGSLFRPQDRGRTAVDVSDFNTLLSHLTNLLYAYTWCIPSDTQQKVTDVSLFDHLKTTAAIATCLYRYHLATNSLNEKAIGYSDKDRFCLVVGDLSGIQEYIFDIAHIAVGGGVARRLRARSFYVQLCSEVAAHTLLHKLTLPIVNMIMNSGGKFYLLVPNLPEAITVLETTQKQVDDWFLQELNGELALNLAWIPFDKEGFEIGKNVKTRSGFGTVLKELSQKLDHRKQNRFVESLCQSGQWSEGRFFVGLPFEGKVACRSCSKFPATEEDDLCIHCHRDRITGSKLTRAKYIFFYTRPNTGDIPVLDYSVSVADDLKHIKTSPYLVLKFNDTDLSDLTTHPAMTKYLAKHVTIFNDCAEFTSDSKPHDCQARAEDPATFECIAHRSQGAELLGFLKVDVDHLGEAFVYGLKRETNPIDTISRITTMSRTLDLFFSGWVEHLTVTEFKDTYTIFSGGDDLFVVGPWNEVISLAERIKDDFDRFSGNPDGLTVSAGMLLAKSSLPVARAAPEVERILKLSKTEGRNRLTILRHTLQWADWQVVNQEWERFKPLLSGDGKIPSAFLYNLLRYAKMWDDYKLHIDSAGKKGDIMGLRYQPLLAYNIARSLDPHRTPELHRWAEELLELRPADKKQRIMLDNLGLIASLLIYSKRGGRE